MSKRKLALVTAGSGGIGSAIVRELVKQNYEVVFTYRSNRVFSEELAQSLNTEVQACSFYPCDVGNENEVKKLCETILEKHGIPYALINNAGITRDGFHFLMEPDDWMDVINTNLNSLFYLNYYLLNAMMQQKDGCIININSISGFRGNAGQTNYSASKSAQYGMTRSLAREVGGVNIRVNCISPGPVSTDMINTIPEKMLRQLKKSTPLRKVAEPEDIAMMVTYLLGRGGRHITGQNIVIDGGLSI